MARKVLAEKEVMRRITIKVEASLDLAELQAAAGEGVSRSRFRPLFV